MRLFCFLLFTTVYYINNIYSVLILGASLATGLYSLRSMDQKMWWGAVEREIMGGGHSLVLEYCKKVCHRYL